MIFVTSGKRYIDIDAYSAIIAYTHLLKSLGKDVTSISTAKFNESICPVIKDINLSLDTIDKNTTINNAEFIILDVSSPEMFDKVVKDNNKIIEIIDHHTGYESYWKSYSNINLEIEFIGSVCTLIFEKYQKYNKLDLLTPDICKLLLAGILDNTLNLKANITTNRDIEACNNLYKIGKIDKSWADTYFLSCQKLIEKDLETSIKNDVKIKCKDKYLPDVFGQLLVLNKDSILEKEDTLIKIMNSYNESWVFNLVCLDDGKSYIISNDDTTKKQMETLFSKKFKNNILILDNFLLRKEIMKKAYNFKNSQ